MFQNATELKNKKEIIVRVGQRIELLQKRTRVLQKKSFHGDSHCVRKHFSNILTH